MALSDVLLQVPIESREELVKECMKVAQQLTAPPSAQPRDDVAPSAPPAGAVVGASSAPPPAAADAMDVDAGDSEPAAQPKPPSADPKPRSTSTGPTCNDSTPPMKSDSRQAMKRLALPMSKSCSPTLRRSCQARGNARTVAANSRTSSPMLRNMLQASGNDSREAQCH
jgi:hypothetical protein